jgi:hypothetical protein
MREGGRKYKCDVKQDQVRAHRSDWKVSMSSVVITDLLSIAEASSGFHMTGKERAPGGLSCNHAGLGLTVQILAAAWASHYWVL